MRLAHHDVERTLERLGLLVRPSMHGVLLVETGEIDCAARPPPPPFISTQRCPKNNNKSGVAGFDPPGGRAQKSPHAAAAGLLRK